MNTRDRLLTLAAIQMFGLIAFSCMVGGSAGGGKLENGIHYLGLRGGHYQAVPEWLYRLTGLLELWVMGFLCVAIVAAWITGFRRKG